MEGIEGNEHVSKCAFRNMLEGVHIVCQADLINIRARCRRFSDIIPTRPSFSRLRHEREVVMEDGCVLASLETGEDLLFFVVGFW